MPPSALRSRFARSVLASIVGAVLAVISAASAAVHSVYLQISPLVNDPLYAVLAIFCLLPLVNLCALAAERAGLVLPMATTATTVRISGSQVAAAAERDMLMFPTKSGGTEERTFTGKSQEQLKGMCRDYNLTVSGNKTQLKARLQEFSERFCNDPASCNLSPVKRRAHKGPRDGPKKTQPKQSTKRRDAIIDTERVTERSKDTRTTDQIKDLLLWADRTVARLPYKPRKSAILSTPMVPEVSLQSGISDRSLHDRMQTIEEQLAAIAASGSQGVPLKWTFASAESTYPVPAPAEYTVYDPTIKSVQKPFPGYDTENLLFNIPSDINWSHTSEYQNLHIGQMLDGGFGAAVTVPTQADIPTSTPCVSSTPGPSHDSAVSTRSVKLGDDTVITITVNQVKGIAIPATSFADDIKRLNQMWDDTSPHWKDDSVVKIDNRSIALIYWPEIFKKTGLWSAHKSNWTEWKFVVERYRQGTPEAFWTTFRSKDGGKMSYTAICASLREERKNADIDLADRARRDYGEEFEVIFSYRCSKTNTRVVMTKASAIAKEYKRLHAL
ncbi:hypothetical protein C8R44DRAFT_891279 [Mycena epipterygia]|nr:hypothetical protein C8R44DRAFT_891279 [Mycena epipterygia]